MVILLNFLPFLVVAGYIGLAFYWYRKNTLSLKRSIALMIVAFLSITVLNAFTPSYMPKPRTPALENPPFEKSEAEITDRSLKPDQTVSEREKTFDDKFDAVKQATNK